MVQDSTFHGTSMGLYYGMKTVVEKFNSELCMKVKEIFLNFLSTAPYHVLSPHLKLSSISSLPEAKMKISFCGTRLFPTLS